VKRYSLALAKNHGNKDAAYGGRDQCWHGDAGRSVQVAFRQRRPPPSEAGACSRSVISARTSFSSTSVYTDGQRHPPRVIRVERMAKE